MHGCLLALCSLTFSPEPIELDRDVTEIHTQDFAMPLHIDPAREDNIERIRVFVSQDRGKTWKHQKDYKPANARVVFSAPQDGFYWFSLQIVFKDGKMEPPDRDDLVAMQKVFVNSERKALKPRKSYEELQQEAEDLRKEVEQLKRRIAELESSGKGK